MALAAAALLATPGMAASGNDVVDTPPPPAGPPHLQYQPLLPDSSVLEPSLETSSDIDKFLARTNLRGLGSEFVKAEADTGVNARFLVGITWVENNAGASVLARTQYNLFSFVGTGPTGFQTFSSYEDSIRQAAVYIGLEYARPGGHYYRGGTIATIGKVYAEDPQWPVKVATSANFIGPSQAPAYAAALRVEGYDGAGLRLRISDQGYAAWDRAGATALLIHYRWSHPGASISGLAEVPAPALRAGGEIALIVPGVDAPSAGAWNLVVTTELAGPGWVTALGDAAEQVSRVDFGGLSADQVGMASKGPL